MIIEKDTVVSFHYRLIDADETVLEDSHTQDQPMVYLHGYQDMVPGVEAALVGKTEGDEIDVVLQEPYGPYVEGKIQRVPIKHLIGKTKPRVGKLCAVNTEQGQRQFTVVKVGRFNVDVDTNHPYAGKTLSYHVKVLALRSASDEEIAHGHAHGPGGHHH